MDLKDFVAETLVEIQQGVQAAIEGCGSDKTTGVINPVWGAAHNVGNSNIREVKFDVAVTVIDKSTDKLGGGIKVMGIGVAGDMSESAERSQVSRIEFSIPIVPPTTTVEGINPRRA